MSSFLRCSFLILILGFLSVDSATQDFCWRDYVPGDIPSDAIEGAPGRYIAQVSFMGNMVGTIFPHSNTAVLDMGGRHDFKKNIRILCSSQPHRFYWDYVNFINSVNEQMQNAVKGGFQDNMDVNLFIGKAMHENEWKIGKVVAIGGNRVDGLWIWNAKKEGENVKAFYLLKYNSTETVTSTTPSKPIWGIEPRLGT